MNPIAILGIIITLFEETQRLADANADLRKQLEECQKGEEETPE